MLDPSPDEMRRLGYAAVDRAIDHLTQKRDKRVVTPPDKQAFEALVREPLPQKGLGIETSLKRYFDQILPRATLVDHPRFFAYIPCPGSFVGTLGSWLEASTNLFTGTWLGGAVMAELELQTLDWLCEALGLGPGTSGIITSGGSMANLNALACARTRVSDLQKARVYSSSESHYSISKAARTLGIPASGVRSIPVDRDQRMDMDALRQAITTDKAQGLEPMAVCATAGTTSTGAFDPIDACARLCEDQQIWLHVDGAYGAALALLPERTDLRHSLSLADSITLDPHKWLYVPLEAGCFLTRHPMVLREAFAADGHYMQDIPRDEVNFFERGPELSRGNRALKLWLLIRSLGIDAIAEAIRADCAWAQVARDLLDADERIEIVTEPSCSVFSFRVRGGEATGQALIAALTRDGRVMLSSSRVDGEFVLRFCVVNHTTTAEDISQSVEVILELLSD